MNKKTTVDELTARVCELIDEGNSDEAVDICTGLVGEDMDKQTRVTALLLRAYSRAAQGDGSGAVGDHQAALELGADELSPVERFDLAEKALSAHMPFGYCARLFSDAGERLGSEDESRVLIAGAFNKAGICLFRDGAPPEEEKACFVRALGVIGADESAPRKEKDTDSSVMTALIRSNLAECLMREGDIDEAARLYTLAAQTFSSHLGKDGDVCLAHYVICQKCLSDIYRETEQNIQAHACLSQSIAELNRRMDKLSDQLRLHLAVCYNARGTLRYQMGNYEGEVEDCTRSLQLRADLSDDDFACATVTANRAEAYAQLGRINDAQEDFTEAMRLFDAIDDNAALASAAMRCFTLGSILADKGMLSEACDTFRSAAERFLRARQSVDGEEEYSNEQLADMESLSRMRLGAALIQQEDRDYFEGLTESREAVRLLEELPVNLDRSARKAALHISMGELYEMFDEPEAAMREYDQADRCREECVRQSVSDLSPDDEEEQDEQQLDDEGDIWADLADDLPQA